MLCYNVYIIEREIKEMKNILRKLEIKKFNKLANEEDNVLFTTGDEINYIYNKKTGKRYFPKTALVVMR
jgi:hypothetical protein